ncbi:MAG: MarR family EPS-associated transcriptional regulator [Pseudomonadota bacterium]|nr:MarR family EPS-associated transcriptional regulator [Pseudomonadota bacterium]
MDSEEVRYRLLELIDRRPQLTQREVADELGVSVGKINYCLRALVERGYVKLGNFRRNPDKLRYRYWLTPIGLEAKALAAKGFLQRKMIEYESLREEIERLTADVESYRSSAEPLQRSEVQANVTD